LGIFWILADFQRIDPTMASAIANFSNVSSSVLTLKGVGSLTGGGGEGIGRIKGNYQQAQKNQILASRSSISGPSPSASQQIDPIDTGNTSDILSQKANQRFGLLVEKIL